jgi:hypothetical protein
MRSSTVDDVDAAMLILERRMERTDDPLLVAGLVARAGALALARMGIEIEDTAEARISIGTDDDPDHAQMTFTWRLVPPRETGAKDE